MAKLPAFQFYPGDWMKDPGVRRCSHAARGVWVDMLCLMFECESRGVLVTGSSPWSLDEVVAAIGGNADVTRACVVELVAKGVCRVREDGAYYSHRMVKDEADRQSAKGRQAIHRKKVAVTAESRDCHAPVTAMSQRSSSSSSSSVISTYIPEAVKIPDCLQSAGFTSAWERWKKHRIEKQKPLGATEEESQLMDLMRFGEEAAAVVSFSIRQGALNLITNGNHRDAPKPGGGFSKRKTPGLEGII